MPRAASRRFLLTLCALGYARTDGKHFELTANVLELGYTYLASLHVWDAIGPYLAEVTETINESCSVAVLEGDQIVYVARSASRERILSIRLGVGARLPAHATSMGHALLADLEPPVLEQYLHAARLQALTKKTLTDRSALTARLRKVRVQGYALADQELEEGLRSLAVPIRDRAARAVAAMNVGVNAARVPASVVLEQYLPVLRKAALRCEEAICRL
jgi:IclR family pca regulon transcriptional regulator